ncbi:late embryogenesis abundant protein At1g64065-like [Aristolochia californica]|uniref:late embryogenesis abundant protein At1g64065-like n=1 Tax=Aristolochia californica TaxID=171875 RepID=UPI0035E0011F
MATRRGLKICCAVTAAVVIIVVVVLITLLFTVFKPKQPKIQPHPVLLKRIEFEPFPLLKLNLMLLVSVTVKNENYGRFRYDASKVFIFYRGNQIGEGPIDAGVITSHGTEDINTTIEISAETMILNKDFWSDLGEGYFNFTSESDVHGQASMLKFLKKHAKARTTCDITVYLAGPPYSKCNTKVKI